MKNKAKPLTRHQTMKWAGNAIAAAAATTTVADAALVQINLIGNQVTASGGDQLFADLDGDGTGDVTFSPFVAPGGPLPLFWSNGTIASYYVANGALVRIDTSLVSARNFGYTTGGFSVVITQGPGTGPAGLMTINLSGVGGNAWLEVQRLVENASGPFIGDPNAGVYLTRVIYDDDPLGTDVADVGQQYTLLGSTDLNGFTPIPEPSGLALLALGAGGLLRRRRRVA